MAIRLPDPFTHPNMAPGFLKAPLVDNDPVMQEELPSGKVLTISDRAQYWSINITYPELFPEEYFLVSSAINESKRLGQDIEIVLPQYANYRVFGDLSLVTISSGQSGNSLTLSNTSHLKGRPHLGDLFQLSTHSKVYKITSVNVTDNTIELGLYPDLFITTTGTEKPKFSDIKFNMVLRDRRTVTEDINADGMYEGVSYNFRESI